MIPKVFPILLTACTPPSAHAWRTPTVELTADADTLAFPATRLGETSQLELLLTNLGAGSATFAVTAGAPFAPGLTELRLGAGQDVALPVWFRPVDYADAAGALVLTSGDAVFTVPLSGAADPDSDDDGAQALAVGGSDCDDADPSVHPGAEDACYDGLDADCAADDDEDCDGDGWPAGSDCDDLDAGASPAGDADGGPDGVDDDCDGLVDEDLLVAGALVLSEVHPDPPAWVEVCNLSGRDVPVTGLTLRTGGSVATLPAATLDAGGCAAWCRWPVAGCTDTLSLVVDHAGDRVEVAAGGLSIDAVEVTGWAWEPNRTWSLSAGLDATANDAAEAWCLTDGSLGRVNPSCP